MAKAAVKPEEKKPEGKKTDGKTPEAVEDETLAPKKKRGKLPLIIGLVVLLAGGGGGAFFFLKGGSGGEKHAEVVAEGKHEPLKPPVFVPLENFTVNLVNEGSEQYLQVAATLKVLDAHTGDAVKQYMPEIRHRMLLWLAAKKSSEINTSTGRERLADELRVITNNILLVAGGKPQRPMIAIAEAKTEEAPVEKVDKADGDEKAETTETADKPKEEGVATAAPTVAATLATTAPAPAAATTPAPGKPVDGTQITKAVADDPIQSVLFTSFIIQ